MLVQIHRWLAIGAVVLLAGLSCKPPQGSSAVSKETEADVADSAQHVQPLLVGARVPPLTLRTMGGEPFDLNEAIATRPTVLVFYRGGWCPFCNTHLGALKEAEPTIRQAGWQMLAIAPDRPEKLVETEQKHQMSYTLLSDSEMTAAKAFGIAFKVDDATLEKYKGYGIDLQAASGQNHSWLPVPAVFLVNTEGIITFEYVNPDYKVRLDPDVLIAEIRSQTSKPAK
jgi:peroxiredoxin